MDVVFGWLVKRQLSLVGGGVTSVCNVAIGNRHVFRRVKRRNWSMYQGTRLGIPRGGYEVEGLG